MGNYHPAFKKFFQDSLEKTTKRNRERGLRMGIGSFGGGVLRLSKREIQSVQGGPTGGQLRGDRTIKNKLPKTCEKKAHHIGFRDRELTGEDAGSA